MKPVEAVDCWYLRWGIESGTFGSLTATIQAFGSSLGCRRVFSAAMGNAARMGYGVRVWGVPKMWVLFSGILLGLHVLTHTRMRVFVWWYLFEGLLLRR